MKVMTNRPSFVRCNSTYRLRYWNFSDTFFSFSTATTVATVLTVYGIETQGLNEDTIRWRFVATVLTVYGIETHTSNYYCFIYCNIVATVLTVYGIETERERPGLDNCRVATVLTVYGIETTSFTSNEQNSLAIV